MRLTREQAKEKLNNIAKVINDRCGAKILWEFLPRPQRIDTFTSILNLKAEVNIGIEEISEKLIVRRTIRAQKEMIELLQDNQKKLKKTK